jgi:hypothetical protein
MDSSATSVDLLHERLTGRVDLPETWVCADTVERRLMHDSTKLQESDKEEVNVRDLLSKHKWSLSPCLHDRLTRGTQVFVCRLPSVFLSLRVRKKLLKAVCAESAHLRGRTIRLTFLQPDGRVVGHEHGGITYGRSPLLCFCGRMAAHLG